MPDNAGDINFDDESLSAEIVVFMLDPRLLKAGDDLISINGSDADIQVSHLAGSLEFTAQARSRFLNADGSLTSLPTGPVDNPFLRSKQRIVEISVISSGDYSAQLPSGAELSSVVEIRPEYEQFDGAPFAVLPDGSVVFSGENPFESTSEIEARQAEMFTRVTMRLLEGPDTPSLHSYTLFVTLDDGMQLEVAWPTVMVE